MAETIEIADGVVHLIEKRTLKSITIEAFKDTLLRTVGFRTQLLPAGTILYAQRDPQTVFVLEQHPTARAIKYRDGKARDGELSEHTIPLPWVYFLAHFRMYALESLRVYFTPQRLRSTDDVLYFAPLPNISSDGAVCLGTYRFQVRSSVPEEMESLKEYFWGSVFNLDITELFLEKMPDRIVELSEDENYFTGWEQIPEAEICAIGWPSCKTLGAVLDQMVGKE